MMDGKGLLVAGALGATLISSTPLEAAYGYCSQPVAPSTYIRKPSRPYCAASRDCDEWQIRSYRSEVDRYYGSLKRYAGEVDEFYNDASAYIKCMAELD